MKDGEFIINGESSLDYDTWIQFRPVINAPTKKVSRKESGGRDGILPFSSGKYNNSPLELILFSKGDDSHRDYENRSRLYNLFDSDGYSDLILYFDPDKIYKVIPDESNVIFESKYYYGDSQSWKVDLSVYPWKYFVDQWDIVLTEPKSVHNQYIDSSLPIIRVDGRGDINLKINDHEFQMKNIHSEGIVLDCEIKKGFRKTTGGVLLDENDKLYTKTFPALSPGRNDISWTGNVNKIVIEPRWRTKV